MLTPEHPHPHRDTIIDGEHPTHTKGVLSALVIDNAFSHMGPIFAENSDYHPSVCN